MKIESLLNTSADKGNYRGSSRSQHTVMLSSLPNQSCKNTHIALKQHRCGQYLRSQYISQRKISTVPAKAHMNGTNTNSLHSQYHKHRQFILYRLSGLASCSQKLWQRHRCDLNNSRIDTADHRRSPRSKYEEEEVDFIWYHQITELQISITINYHFISTCGTSVVIYAIAMVYQNRSEFPQISMRMYEILSKSTD